MTEELFRPTFVPDKFREAVSGKAWGYLGSAATFVDRALDLYRNEVRA